MGSDLSLELASLPIRLGGAGIASPLPICDAAVVSSWIGGVFGSVGGPTVSIPEGFQLAVQNLAGCSPALGRPLLAALQTSGLRNHQLRARWADQSAWSEEIFRHRAVAFDASVDQRLQG